MNYVVLAGGIGERLWPLGSPEKPKQFHAVVGDKPLIVAAVDRVKKAGGDIYFSTTPQNVPLIKELFPEVADDHYIVEPSRRDTGPAMAYAAAVLAKTVPDEPMAFIPADHVIEDEDRFVRLLQVAESLIKETGKMLDIGIPAVFPSTVLGYTHVGDKTEKDGVAVYEFLDHTEKPDLVTAKKYVESGEYLWHGNYYMWTPTKILEALQKYAPEIYDGVMQALDNPAAYNNIKKISFDYAITEHMDPKDVTILGGDFGWSDAGAWDTLYDELKESDGANVTKGEVVALDSSGSLVHSETGRKVGVIGLQDMIVVDTKEGLLVCPKDRAQDVKKLLAEFGK